MGLNQPRLEGDEYLQVVDEFVAAVKARWPKVLIQVRVALTGPRAAARVVTVVGILRLHRLSTCVEADWFRSTALSLVAPHLFV